MIVANEWYCSNENAPGGYPGCAVSHCRRLIRIVHHAEGVDDQIGWPSSEHRREAPNLQQLQPRTAMRTGELADAGSLREPARRGKVLHRVGSLSDQGLRFGAQRLFGKCRVTEQLGQAA